MPENSLRKFNAHYYLSPADRAEQRRLDALRMKVLEHAFELAIDRARLPRDGELCIRNVSAPVRFRLNASDQTIVMSWSLALAENLNGILREPPHSGRVFYYSRRQAIFDLVLSVSRNDYQRAWAWQLLGLWKSERRSDRDAPIQLVSVLRGEPNLIVPALRLVATHQTLPALARRLSVEQWAELAHAASSSAGVDIAPNTNEQSPSSQTYNHALRVLRRSSILAGVVHSGALARADGTHASGVLAQADDTHASSALPILTERETMRRAIATLAVLDVEPALLRRKSGASLLALVAASFNDGRAESFARSNKTIPAGKDGQSKNAGEGSISESRNDVPQPVRPGETRRYAGRSESVTSHTSGTSNQFSDDPAFTTAESFGQAGRKSAERTAADHADDSARAQAESFGDAERQSATDGAADNADDPARASAESFSQAERQDAAHNEAPDPRRNAITEFGGLLFLVALIDTLKLPEEMLADAMLGSRPLTWTLYQLALALVPAQPNDAAVLAFAGLPPDAMLPSEHEPDVNENERQALNNFVNRIVETLSARVDYEYDSVAELLEFVCCRRAQIVADPGWIEIRFSHDQVATEIRRAALDLDPGYVSWLGVVVKFVYE